eukprot:10924005-Lingulodinium_polyedra.AAC.1
MPTQMIDADADADACKTSGPGPAKADPRPSWQLKQPSRFLFSGWGARAPIAVADREAVTMRAAQADLGHVRRAEAVPAEHHQ